MQPRVLKLMNNASGVLSRLGPFTPLNLGQYCASRGATVPFAHVVRNEILQRTLNVVQLLHEAPSSILLAESHRVPQAAWFDLAAIAERELALALELYRDDPLSREGTSMSLDPFLDGLSAMRSRDDVLSLLLQLNGASSSFSSATVTPSSEVSGKPPLIASSDVTMSSTSAETWCLRFLSQRIMWHVLQEDFLQLCDGGGATVVEQHFDLTRVIEDAAVKVHAMAEAELGIVPHISLEFDRDEIRVCGVSEQIRYVVQEIVKNACVATVMASQQRVGPHLYAHASSDTSSFAAAAALPTVRIRAGIAQGGHRPGSDGSDEYFFVNVEDGAGGVPSAAMQRMWSLGWSSQLRQRRIAGFGVGLPLARVYANLFGGSLTAAKRCDGGTPGTIFTLIHPVVGKESP